MKKIGIALMALSVSFLVSCKSEPKQDDLVEGEVIQTPEGLEEEADALHDFVEKAKDSLKQDFEKAGESIEETIEDIQKENQKLQENIEKAKKEAEKK
ncbi:hypothetical protein K5I29_10005 [Flavobacterium agricola]|uniref:Lipoprotein n=1 Tax=Flavobacterium agricola TaxID=2870839 RepID=A0ABY6LZJ6_9FLAO|nr:hypothetical protein [Flavobacterium agricola]UYW00834.1 hypothetical protein K5I29_10005 [Flavobacterium agricola]